MASTQSSQSFFANNKVAMYDHDPDSTNATAVEWVDMRDFGEFACVAMASALTGNGITKAEIVASAASNGASAEVIKDSGTIAADAVGDQAALSCTGEELAQIGTDSGKELRYVSMRLTHANAADEAVVTYILAKPRFAYKDLTPATTIA